MQKLRDQCFGKEVFPQEVLDWIEKENLWNLWVPKSYGGLEMSFSEGLLRLKKLAEIDGSLGWTVTLCSGANYFIGNLKPEIAKEIFLDPDEPVCLGGSGGAFGTAEKSGNHYLISGRWRYATGAPYLTHFTLNARIIENGKELTNLDGSPCIRSFVVPAKEVSMIEDWETMGLKATATHSFEVQNVKIHTDFSFLYNDHYLPQPIFRINFSLFADLTLWVNYLGMAEHYLREASAYLNSTRTKVLQKTICEAEGSITYYTRKIEKKASCKSDFSKEFIENVHRAAGTSVKALSRAIIELHPYLGVKASKKTEPLNQIFRDYFTATQHHIFTQKN